MPEILDLNSGLWPFLPCNIKVETSNCTEKKTITEFWDTVFHVTSKSEGDIVVLCNVCFTIYLPKEADFLSTNRKFEVRFRGLLFLMYQPSQQFLLAPNAI